MIELRPTPFLWLLMILLASIIDYFIGDPYFLYHPVKLIGSFINFLTKILNKKQHRKFKGFILVLIVVLTVILVVITLQYLLYIINSYLFFIVNTWFLSTCLCEKSLFKAGQKVKNLINDNNINEAKFETGLIVGRETTNLNKKQLIQAVVETEAENGIDGIISPLFYMFLGTILSYWLPLLNPLVLSMLYKAINTMDSMIGYNFEPFKEFGFYAANLDDFFNYVPARLGSYSLILSGYILGFDGIHAYEIYKKDRYSHPSPNAGHPESVISGLLGIQLGGSHLYNGNLIRKPTIGKNIFKLSTKDIDDTIRLVLLSEIIFIFSFVVFMTIIGFFYSLFF